LAPCTAARECIQCVHARAHWDGRDAGGGPAARQACEPTANPQCEEYAERYRPRYRMGSRIVSTLAPARGGLPLRGLRDVMPATSAPGFGSPAAHIRTGTGLTRCPHLHRDWAHPLAHLPQDWALRCHICTGTGPADAHRSSLWSKRCWSDRNRDNAAASSICDASPAPRPTSTAPTVHAACEGRALRCIARVRCIARQPSASFAALPHARCRPPHSSSCGTLSTLHGLLPPAPPRSETALTQRRTAAAPHRRSFR
jgi:hypothetical protein